MYHILSEQYEYCTYRLFLEVWVPKSKYWSPIRIKTNWSPPWPSFFGTKHDRLWVSQRVILRNWILTHVCEIRSSHLDLHGPNFWVKDIQYVLSGCRIISFDKRTYALALSPYNASTSSKKSWCTSAYTILGMRLLSSVDCNPVASWPGLCIRWRNLSAHSCPSVSWIKRYVSSKHKCANARQLVLG